MSQAHSSQPELPNIVTLLEETFKGNAIIAGLRPWELVIFSIFTILALSFIAILAKNRMRANISGRLQGGVEMFVGGFDEFIQGILGPQGRKYTPFIGTMFIYILFMNLMGLVPLLKPPTSNWSTTLALALCVFFYLQFTAFKELGFRGYVDHMLGKPRGILALSVVIPLLMFFLHIVSELLRPISLSLRLRSNIWGEDMLMAVLAKFGIMGSPLLLFNMFLGILASLVQACVFCLLTTIYFALLLEHE